MEAKVSKEDLVSLLSLKCNKDSFKKALSQKASKECLDNVKREVEDVVDNLD